MVSRESGFGLKLPSVEITELTRDHVHFTLRNTDASFANALRRVMIAEVPTLAIELVTILENSSVFHDEFLAHRFGLLPIDSSRVRDFKNKEECSCSDRCPNCVVEYQLDVFCQDDENITVTHLDLVGTSSAPDSPMPVPRLEDVVKQNGTPIEIAKLSRNQRIKCQLLAVKGVGKLHAKWIPVATATFQYEPDIQINQKILETVPLPIQQKIADACHKKVFTCEGDAFTPPTLTITNPEACDFTDEVISVAREHGFRDLIKISHKPDVFKFIVESTGALSPEQIVDMAFEILEKKAELLIYESSKLEKVDDIGKTYSKDHQRDQKSSRPVEDFVLDLQ